MTLKKNEVQKEVDVEDLQIKKQTHTQIQLGVLDFALGFCFELVLETLIPTERRTLKYNNANGYCGASE